MKLISYYRIDRINNMAVFELLIKINFFKKKKITRFIKDDYLTILDHTEKWKEMVRTKTYKEI